MSLRFFKGPPRVIPYYQIDRVYEHTPLTGQQVADLFCVSRRTVVRAKEYSNNSMSRAPVGRPRLLQKVHLDYIALRTDDNPFLTNAELSRELREFYVELNGRVDASTVSRARKDVGFRFRPMVPNCVPNRASETRRINWCQQQQEMETNWEKVVFSDESWFELGSWKQYCWQHMNDHRAIVSQLSRAHPEKVMIWGAIGQNFKSKLIFLDETIDGDDYFKKIIQASNVFQEANGTFGEGDWLLQQDNARPHIRKDVVRDMKEMGIRILENWPPYSPDLNIIERVWAIMKLRVGQLNPQNGAELRDVIQLVWDELSFSTINSLVSEMPNRLIKVIAHDGRTIQHL